MSALQTAADRAERWLTDVCLPLWAERGVDPDGAFYELLDFEGQPKRDSTRRMRVQARQLYVFSEAALRGWLPQARAISDRGFERFVADCWAPDGQPGFIHTMNPDRTPLDARRDMYDHSFGLFALAWRYKAAQDERARALAEQVLDFVDTRLADKSNGGFVEGDPAVLPRRADPHMHFLEACLEWRAATGEATFLSRAQSMVDLFTGRFFNGETLGEYFAADLGPLQGPEGQVVMPGHHAEWVWLLDQARKAGVVIEAGLVETLYDHAIRHGLDARGLAVDELDRQGRQVRASRRAWPQTELIKAHLTMAERGHSGAADAAAAVTHAFFDTYLATEVPGIWMDQFDAEGRGVTPNVPASTLYHVVVAFRELLLAAARTPA
jgi:mannose/cellobiose epimerase-like protein (N-acyl-D-glucosamine 2-epimerase family)